MDIALPVPTPHTLLMNALCMAGAVVYYCLLATCVLFLLYAGFAELRDWIRTKKTKKYEQEDAPIEWILDYPGYALSEYSREDSQ